VDVLDDSVNFRLNFPITVTRGGSSIDFNDIYEVSYPIRLGRIRDVANQMIVSISQDPEFVDMTFLENTGYDTTVYLVDEDTTFYSIVDSNSNIDGVDYVFQFANKF